MIDKIKTGKERLKELAENRSKNSNVNPIDWEKKKQTWVEQLSRLYIKIGQWLKDIEGIKLQRQKIWITEEYIGRYNVDRLLLYIGDNLISLTPRGTLIIAARGRIDVQSSNNKRTMIILEKKGERPQIITTINSEQPLPPPKPEAEIIEYEWLIVGEKRKNDFTILNEDTFTGLIADMIE